MEEMREMLSIEQELSLIFSLSLFYPPLIEAFFLRRIVMRVETRIVSDDDGGHVRHEYLKIAEPEIARSGRLAPDRELLRD